MAFDMTKDELTELLREIVADAIESHPLTDEEVQWVRLAIKAESERAALRKAIIEKSLASLFWLAIVAAGGWIADYIAAHWKA